MLSTLLKRTASPVLTRARLLSTTPSNRQNPQHTPDTYSKEVDSTPPPAGSTVHRVDPSNDAGSQKPNEDSSSTIKVEGKGGKPAGYETAESGTGGGEPYAPSGGQDRRYGGKETYGKEKGPETSGSDEGPAGKNAGGRS